MSFACLGSLLIYEESGKIMEYIEFDWWKFILFMILIGLFLAGIDRLMRKVFKVEKRKSFSHNHLNEQHKKWDWTLRIVFFSLMSVSFFIYVNRDMSEFWYLAPWTFIFLLIFLSEGLRAFMEWKYASNRKQYMYTISMIGVYIIFLVAVLIIINSKGFEVWLY
ncbi:DUF4181 domain-containing protein [Virgibacillus halodenitrificans]|uniref:DUF4181 domain-containing protein n=1 Tax=Virgibacillus halodenitrificans TaxID=1482 RepID=UPI000317BEF9|nr:DUF4181 domain-containing protein [Virgibacillus halodenitrificans]